MFDRYIGIWVFTCLYQTSYTKTGDGEGVHDVFRQMYQTRIESCYFIVVIVGGLINKIIIIWSCEVINKADSA